jgi:hypothetical protein
MTRSEASEATLQAFATFRIAGDRLVPDEVTRILRVPASQSYAKGEHYWGGPRSPNLVGRTGVWYLSTDRMLASKRLDEHLAQLIAMLTVQRGEALPLIELNRLLAARNLKAHVSCYWFGRRGTRKPVIPPIVSKIFGLLPAEIETDFATEEKNVA